MLHYFKNTFVHKQIRQPNGAGPVIVTNRIEVKPLDQSLESLKSELFSSFCGIFDIKMYVCHTAD